ncbi:Ig-like domain-containing protein [Flavobacterium sp.]|uniref:Ig-like domain-containing protein n=1 Tax=Flavobacterium sp. TaxID=239 RepID=UPI003C5A4682
MMTLFSGYSQTVAINGESPFRKWDRITVALSLPSTVTESDTSFKNNRMDVIFTDPNGNKIRVPGYFAADGNAANTSATTGSLFKAYLRPYATGNWTYQVLFYSGTDVSLKDVNQLPTPTYNLSGTINNVTNAVAVLPDLRAKGRLEYQTTGTNNQRRYLKWAETGEYFLKFGPDSPENLLDYNDFDHIGTKNTCGLCTEHSYSPHTTDWKTGDPTWNGGKGKNLIGAINYLKNEQINSMSMSLFGGDDKNVYPWTTLSNKFQYDVSKLDQWEIVLNHAEKNGLVLHLKFAEAENWNALSLDEIKVYYREMVARFGHHLGLEWNISEEFGGKDGTDPANAIPRINWLASIDPWQNHRVIHTYPGTHETYYNYFINNNANITGASIQSGKGLDYNDSYDGKSGIKTWVDASKNAGKPWVVASDEQNPGSTGMFTSEDINDNTVIPQARKKILWKGLMGGGAGVMWYGGSQGDFKTENFNRFSTMFEWSKIAILQFIQGNGIEYWKMQNNDALATGDSNKCLAQVGQRYIIYLENGGACSLNLSGESGNFNVKWFNPRDGGGLQNGSVTSISGGASISIGNPPSNTTSDWVALITKSGGQNIAVTGISITPQTATVEQSKTISLVTVITPTNASDKTISWTTSNASTATVSNGIVTGVAKGTATITGTTQDGNFIASSVITVTEAPAIESGCNFEEENGLLIIETESAANYEKAQFTLETGAVGTTTPTGTGYLRYTGPDHFGAPVAAHTLSYKIKITNPGIYQFLWRNVRDPQAATGDAANDAFLNIKDNNVRFYGIKAGVEYTLTAPTKVWIQKSDFVYECYGETHAAGVKINGMSMWANFPTAGEYTIEHAGRSKGHSVDRIVLFKSNRGADAKNILTPESNREKNCVTNPTPNPTCANIDMNAIDFPITQVTGFVAGYIDNVKSAMAINAAQHKGVFAAVKQNFSGNDGTYDITINTLSELDGESTYVLKVGGVLVGTHKNGETSVDYKPETKTWTGINVKKGDEIQVEFSSHTNGKIPEGATTAYSRGRWTKLSFVCSGTTIPVTESVDFSNLPASFSDKTTTFSLNAIYSAKEQRDINITLKTPDNIYIADKTITVNAGNNQTASINVTVSSPLAINNDYRFVIALRTIGGDYTTNIEKKIALSNIIDVPLSTKVVAFKNSQMTLTVYPNPIGNKNLTVKLTGADNSLSYSISDMNGKLIKSGNSDKNEFMIPSEAFPSQGIYLLKVNANGQQLTKKIIK